MKKLLFTAIAMVAFSSASMANTIADEGILKKNSQDMNLIIKAKSICEVIAEAQAQLTYNQTGNQNAANTSYMLALTACLFG